MIEAGIWQRNGLAWTPLQGLPYAERLDGFYGDTERRISHETALLKAGMPMKAGLSVSADMDDKGSAADYFICHHRESHTTLKVSAKQLDSKTWMSSPERALLEYAQDCPSLSAEETLMLSFYSGALSDVPGFWERLVALSSRLDFSEGVRRIASAASMFGKHDLSENDMKFLNSVPPTRRHDCWIEMTPQRKHVGCRPIVFKDRKHKVLWRISPEEVFDILEH